MRPHAFRTTWARAVAAAAALGIVIVSLLPEGSVDPGPWNAGHVFAYALLACAGFLSLDDSRRTVAGVAWVVVAVSALGLGIEVLQPAVGRTLSLRDILSNELGILAACAVSPLLNRAVTAMPERRRERSRGRA